MLKSRIARSKESVLANASASSAFAASSRTQSGWSALSAFATAMRASLLSSTTKIRYFIRSRFPPIRLFQYHSTPPHKSAMARSVRRRSCTFFWEPSLTAAVTYDFVQIEHDQHPAVAEKRGPINSGHAGKKALRRFQHDVQPLAQAIDLEATPLAANGNDQHGGIACRRAGFAAQCLSQIDDGNGAVAQHQGTRGADRRDGVAVHANRLDHGIHRHAEHLASRLH